MSKKGKFTTIAFSFLLIMGVFFDFSFVLAYSPTTHSFLTEQIAKLYNQIYDPDLTPDQIQQLVQGSFNEDTAPRWINHFYDPLTGDGWLGKRLGNISDQQVQQISKIIFGKTAVDIKDWAHNQELQQNSYYRYEGNRTLEGAVLFFLNKQDSKAFNSLGYVLHLVQDMAVPAHTRQDSHFDMAVPKEVEDLTGIKFDKGEPYENWAKDNAKSIDVGKLVENYKPICFSLDDCLDILALYSNNNFFSSDTILDQEYSLPDANYSKDVVEDGKIVKYYYNGSNYLLGKSIFLEKQNIFSTLKIDYSEINQTYWDNLAPKAILAGVEVVKYFQDQLVRAKDEEIVIKTPDKPELITLLTGISLYGEAVKTYKKGGEFAVDFYERLKGVGQTGKNAVDKVVAFLKQPDIFQSFLSYLPPGPSIEETIFSEKIELPTLSLPDDEPVTEEQGIELTTTDLVGIGGPLMGLLGYNYEQEELDEIAEKVDIIRQQVKDILAGIESNLNGDQEENEQEEQEEPNDQDEAQNQNQTQTQNTAGTGTGSGATPNLSYLKVLLSEIQIAGISDEKEEFIELYNPNESEIDLTDWYLQKKTKTSSSYSTFVSSTLFAGKKILAKGYFVIARKGSSLESISDIVVDNAITEDNSFVLKNPNREISDKVGFGLAQEYETSPFQNPAVGQSIGRKWNTTGNIEQDTDNNLVDFELQKSSPKSINVAYVQEQKPGGNKDTTAPSVVFDLDSTQTELTFAIDFEITDPITTVSPSNIKGYTLRWKEDNGDWQEDAYQDVLGSPEKYLGKKSFTGKDQTIYYFQIRTEDMLGNKSDWQTETPAETKIVVPKIVLVNEIQVAGLSDVNEEFVELYNPTLVDIDLTGWYLQKKSKDGTSFSTFVPSALFSGKKIKSKGYFLISNSDSSFAKISDVLTTYSLAKDNSLALKNSDGDIIDKVGFGFANDFETKAVENPLDGQSVQRKWDIVNSVHQDTNDNSLDFEKTISSPKPSSPKTEIKDITDYPRCMGSSSPGTQYYFLTIQWSSFNLNIDYYDVQYKVNNGSWNDWILKTTDTKKVYSAYNSMFADYVYHFRARAVDKEGNEGEYQELTIDLTNPVVINEVAFFGTNARKADKWIELYNKSNNAVDLAGWQITFGSNFKQILQGIIPAKGYFVLEPTDDSSIADILASQTFGGVLGGTPAYLINQNNRQVDKFYIPSGGWQESDFIKEGITYSMERISPYEFGYNSKNWKINNGTIKNGNDRGGSPIYGTPASQNSNYQLYTPLSTDFVDDTVLPLSLSPYFIYDSQRVVFKDKVLTIEPGVVIKFYGSSAGLRTEGTLKAIGKADQKIVFTAFYDDEYGGDTNQDNGANLPQPGIWTGLKFTKDSVNSELDNIILRYAGYNYAEHGRAGIKVEQSSISLTNSTIEKNLENEIVLSNSSSIIDNVKLLDTAPAPYNSYAKGIYIQGASPNITNSYFKNNKDGIYISSFWDENNIEFSADPIIENNNFENNTNAIFVSNKCSPSFANNQAKDNEFNGIILGADIQSDIILKKDLPYIVKSNIGVSSQGSLTIEPGVVIKFYGSSAGLEIKSTLKAIGTEDQPIVFTSLRDDEYGGDTDQDSGVNIPQPGTWSGIYFIKTATNLSELDHILLRYGGYYTLAGGIKADQVSISLKNSVVEKIENSGLWLVNSSSVVDNSQFSEIVGTRNSSTGGKGIYVQGASPEIKNSNILNNYFGLYIDKYIDWEHIEFLANVVLSDNTFAGNIKADIWDTMNPPPN